MSSPINEFAEAETGVFWDVVDCEVPNDLSLDLVCENIKSALADDGYRGKVSVRAYCEIKRSELIVPSEFESSGIKLVRSGDRRARRNQMLEDLIRFAIDHKQSSLMYIKSAVADAGYRGKVSIHAYCDTEESEVAVASAFESSGIKLVRAGDTNSRRIRMLQDVSLFAVDHKPTNLMVISQDISTESLYVKLLLKVKKRNHNLLLAQIDKVKGELLSNISSIWYWKDLSGGGRPCEDGNNINTSEFAEADMGIFWDIVDCEIPNDLSLDLVSENIKSALADDGYRGKVSISAYCEMKKSKAIVASEFESCGIELVRAGDRRARRNQMLEDLLFFAIDHKPPSSLMVISKDISKDSLFVQHLLTLKQQKNRNLLVAQIDKVTGDLFASVSSIWYWTHLANGGVPAFQSTIDKTSTSNLKRCPDVDSNTSGTSQGGANKRVRP